jgi:homoserine O-succinyltransferase/O-acetyltransferase
MPLVANTELPSFARLREEGETIIERDRALHQDIRELHIGLLNMMPDSALEATERQFFRLIGESNQIAQFYIHPFSLSEIDRNEEGLAHINKYYKTFNQIKEEGLDALIITGANVSGSELSEQPFWDPLIEIIDWSYENVTSTLCSCLATHAVLQFRYNQMRKRLPMKRWGVYSHKVVDQHHPLVTGVNTRFNVPHSRFNEIRHENFSQASLKVLVESETAGVHMATSEDGFRIVFFQGHPEYDAISLLKEYKREVGRYINSEINDYPPIPENYLTLQSSAILEEYQQQVILAYRSKNEAPAFPEDLIVPTLDNTWHDTAEAVINNWIGKVYQVTHIDRCKPFRDDINPDDPLGLNYIRE